MKHLPLWLFGIAYLLIFSLYLDKIPMIAMDEGWNAFYALDQFGDNPHALSTSIQYKLFFLYYLLLAGWMKIWGISLVTVRAFAVFSGLFGLIGLYQLLCHITSNKKLISAGLFAFLMCNITVVTFRWGRPEGLILVLLIWALFFLVKAIQENRPKLLNIVGLLMGLMVLTHPYSVLVVFATLSVLKSLPFKPILSYRYFISGGLIIGSIMIIRALFWDFDYLQTQFIPHITERLSFMDTSQSLLDKWVYFWHSYTLGIKRLYILLFEIGILIYGALAFRKDPLISNISRIGLLSFIFGMLILSPFRRRYMGIVMICSLITSIVMLCRNKTHSKKIITLCLLVYVTNNMLGNLYYIYKHRNNTPYSTISKQLHAEIPPEAKVIAPIQLWIALHPIYTVTNIHNESKSTALKNILNTMDYSANSPYFLRNISPTTSDPSIGHNLSNDPFHITLTTETQKAPWHKKTDLHGVPYDTISIYKKAPSP